MTVLPRSRRRRGLALLIVITVAITLATLAFHFHEVAANRLRLGRTHLDRYRALQIARSGVLWAETALSLDRRPFHARPEDLRRERGNSPEEGTDAEKLFALFEASETKPLPFGDGLLSVEIRDEDSRLNLNRTDAYSRQFFYNLLETLDVRKRKVLEITGDTVQENRNAEMSAALVDWIDRDETVTPGGAEDSYYGELDPPYRCRNSFLQDPWELALLRDFDGAALGNGLANPTVPDRDGADAPAEEGSAAATAPTTKPGLLSCCTIYGTSYRVNFNTASSEVLRALPGVFGNPLGANLERLIVENRPHRTMNELIQVINASQPEVWRHMQIYAKVTSQYFRVRSTGRIGRAAVTVEAVVKTLGQRCEILSWRQV